MPETAALDRAREGLEKALAHFTSELGFKVFLDRYTVKDLERNFQPGDLALVLLADDPRWPKKEVGLVLEASDDGLVVEVITGSQKGERLKRPRAACDRPLERAPEELWRRVARTIAACEDEGVRSHWEGEFYFALDGWRFVPGGRILAGAGASDALTLYNCYVVPCPEDSRRGIVDTLSQMIEIMSRGGGVGINVSSLRPRRAIVRGVNGRSSGAVSWMDLYSRATGLVEQGGCFGPDERIATDHGLVPAAELFGRMGRGEKFRALTHEGLRPIVARFQNGTKRLYRVTTRRGFLVEVTAEHKMGVLRQGSVATVPLQELSVGDEVLTLLGDGVPGDPVALRPLEYVRSKMSTRLNEQVRLPNYLDARLAYVLGYMHGDGYVQVGQKVTWQAAKAVKMATADDRPELRDRLVEFCRELFGIEPVVEPGDGACQSIVLYSRHLVEWLSQNSLLKAHAEAVRVPEAVFRASGEVMGAFVAGHFDAGGSDRGQNGGYGIDSISLGMLRDLQQLLAANGIAGHITATDRSAFGWQTIYRLAVTGSEFKERFSRFAALSLKAERQPLFRTHFASYPQDVFSTVGVGDRYYQGLWDSTKDRISDHAPSRIRDRVDADANSSAVAVVERTLRVLPDEIVGIEPSKMCEVYDFEVEGTHMLSGGGVYTSNSRRGALMLMLWDWHPDLLRFIDSKRTPGMVENANISVCITDKFMQAVKEDREWVLRFPDTDDEMYDTLWDGDLQKWEAAGRPIIDYEKLSARQIWAHLTESAWASAEPGIVFLDRANKTSNSWYFHPLIATNPCAEQPLPAWGVCCLGHVNLSRFVIPAEADQPAQLDWDGLGRTVRAAVRFLDDVVDTTPYHFPENETLQKSERRLGMGTMGLGEVLIRLGIRYGSRQAAALVDRLYGFIAHEAYLASSDFAKEKGPFPQFDADRFLASGFMQGMPEDVRERVAKNGVRNVTLLTQAPTGTVGTMVGTSTGIEPFYALKYFRQSRLGFDEQYVKVAQDWLDTHPGEELPPEFAGAMDLTPEEHIQIQAAVQRWTDSSISKTANAPADYTVEDTRKLYELAYDLGCKGVTIYRDQSRSEQVLHLEKDEGTAVPGNAAAAEPAAHLQDSDLPALASRPRRMTGTCYLIPTHFGNLTLDVHEDENGEPFEVIASAGTAGSDLMADAVALGMSVSVLLRMRSRVPKEQRLEIMIDKFRNIGGSKPGLYGPFAAASLAQGLARGMEQYLQERRAVSSQKTSSPPVADEQAPQVQTTILSSFEQAAQAIAAEALPGLSAAFDLCPACGTYSMEMVEGCRTCHACGFSNCS